MINKKLIVKFLAIASVSIFLFFTFFDFVALTNSINTRTIRHYLEDIGKETVNNYNYEYSQLSSIINNVSCGLSELDLNKKEISDFLNASAKDVRLFERIWYIDSQRVFHNYNDEIELSLEQDFVDDIFYGNAGITETMVSPYSYENIIIVYAPVMKNNGVAGGVCGVVKMNNENKENVYEDALTDNTYSFMTDCHGNIISKIKNKNNLYEGNNYLTFLKYDVKYIKGDYKTVIENMKNNKSDFASYRYNREERFVYYTPAKLNDWYVFNIVSADSVKDLNTQMNEAAVHLVIKITLLFAVITFFIVRYFKKLNLEHIAMNNKVMTTNRKIEMILKQTSERIFEYDIENDSLTLDAWNDYPKTIFNHFLSNLHNYNFVSRQHEPLLKEKFREIIETKESLSFDARLPYINKDRSTWFHISIAYVPENNQLIGTLHNNTKEMKEYNLLLQDQMFKNSIYSHSYFMFAVNLRSKKVVIYQDRGEYHNVNDVNYEDFMTVFLKNAFEDDKDDVSKFFHFDHILSIYNDNGKNTIDFRYLNPANNKYEWFCFNVEFERQSSNNELLMIAYCVDINEEKSQQLEYEYRAKRDGLTDLYNKQTFQRLVDEYLVKRTSVTDYCACMICDLDNFKTINDTFGHSFGDAVIKEVARVLEKETAKCGYAARFGGDEFMVFFYSQESYAPIEMKAREILKQVKEIKISKMCDISASMGIKFVKNEKSYKELFDKCDQALYISKESGKGIYTVYNDGVSENTGL